MVSLHGRPPTPKFCLNLLGKTPAVGNKKLKSKQRPRSTKIPHRQNLEANATGVETWGGGGLRNPIAWGVLNPPFFTTGVWGGFKGVFRRRHTISTKNFSWYSFGMHIQSFVLAPNSATFDIVPLARDPPECKGDVAFPPFFGLPRRQG